MAEQRRISRNIQRVSNEAGHRSTRINKNRRTYYRRWIIILILLLSLSSWIPYIGSFLIVSDPLQTADALVPLAGDRIRVIYGADLFKRGYAHWFVVTDMWIDATSPSLLYANSVRWQAEEQGVPNDRILVSPGMPKTTYAEALSLRQLAQEQGWKSLIIVTSPYHTRRSRMILRDVFLDTGITIIIQPVHTHWYQSDSWWKSQQGWSTTLTEYLKLGLYIAGYR